MGLGFQRFGKRVCGRFLNDRGEPECPYPIPDIDGDGAIAFHLFMRLQTQWNYAPMTGQRLGIPREALAIEANARGIELNESILDKFAACEAEIRRADSERIEAAEANK